MAFLFNSDSIFVKYGGKSHKNLDVYKTHYWEHYSKYFPYTSLIFTATL